MTVPLLPPAFLALPLAHRAFHDPSQGIIENSPSAVRRAVDAGYGIEVDVQLTADGHAVVFHDKMLDRLTGETGPVHDRTAADLANIALSGTSDTIATLEEILSLVAGRVPILVELKDQSRGLGSAEPVLERAVAAALEGYDGPAAVMSFNPYMVGALAKFAPAVPRGLVSSAFLPSIWPKLSPEIRTHLRTISAFDQVQASFISHRWTDLDSPRVAELKSRGVPILCWTIKSAEDEATARHVADTITFEGYDAVLGG